MAVMFNFLKKSRLLKSVLYEYRRIMFIHSRVYREFRANRTDNRLIFMSDIDHGNLGDHALVYAEQKMLEDMRQYAKYCFGRKYCLAALDLIVKECRSTDVMLIPGGGWVGTLWKESGELFIEMLENLGNSHIIVLPQTIYFENTVYGKAQEKRMYAAIQKCANLKFCVRDRNSYEFLVEKMPEQNEKVKYYLYPDMALSLTPDLRCKREKKLLVVMRKDKEKVMKDDVIKKVIADLKQGGYQAVTTDTVLSRHVKPALRETALYKKWMEFGTAELVITDRLHGMIFAVITNTPCIAFDNSNHKVKGVYSEWLRDFSSLQFVNDKEDISKIVGKVKTLIGHSDEDEKKQLEKLFEEMKRELFYNIEVI